MKIKLYGWQTTLMDEIHLLSHTDPLSLFLSLSHLFLFEPSVAGRVFRVTGFSSAGDVEPQLIMPDEEGGWPGDEAHNSHPAMLALLMTSH